MRLILMAGGQALNRSRVGASVRRRLRRMAEWVDAGKRETSASLLLTPLQELPPEAARPTA